MTIGSGGHRAERNSERGDGVTTAIVGMGLVVLAWGLLAMTTLGRTFARSAAATVALGVTVVKVVDLSEGEHIERELMLVKVRAIGKDREEMKRMADIFRGRIIDVTDKDYTIELTGTGSKLDAFLKAIDRAAILETVRTGASGIGRGDRVLRV